MEAHKTFPVDSIEKVMEADSWARDKAREQLRAFTGE
jgi:hypothetical protein